MVFVWSNLTDGEPNFTLTQVALNDTIMVFAFAPIVGLLLGLSSITVPWDTLFLSVVLYIVVPVIGAQVWRRSLLASGGEAAVAGTLRRLQPISLLALLGTLVLLFGFQGDQIVAQPVVIVLLAIPSIIQVYLNAGIAYWLNRVLGVPPICADWRIQLFRACRGGGYRAVRFPVWSCVGDGCGRARRGSGDVVLGTDRDPNPRLVSGRLAEQGGAAARPCPYGPIRPPPAPSR